MNKRVFLTSMISIAVLAIACILLALPGQFASLGGSKTAFSGYEVIFNAGYVDGINISGIEYDFITAESCYEVIFNAGYVDGINYLNKNAGGHASVAGIIALVLIVLSVVAFAFNKASNVLPLLGGIMNLVSGIIFLAMNLTMITVYSGKLTLSWTTYVVGSLLVLISILTIAISVKALIDENHQLKSPKSQRYSYIKK